MPDQYAVFHIWRACRKDRLGIVLECRATVLDGKIHHN
jgi:hypothetical protein